MSVLDPKRSFGSTIAGSVVKKRPWLILIPGAMVATLTVVVMLTIAASEPEWSCSCDAGEWHYVGPNGVNDGRDHLDATGHTTSCKRTDRAATVVDRMFDTISPGS